MRGDVSAIGGVRSGSSFGAINQRNRRPTPPTIAVGNTHSNMLNLCMPRSLEIPTTSKLVDVPIVVDMPPTIVAKPIGIMTPETGNFARSDAPTRIGMSNTTIGVLFMNALSTAAATSVISRANTGLVDHARATKFASGCNAPVVSSALPTIINAQIATSASLPKPAKKSLAARTTSPPFSYGKREKPPTRIMRIARDDDSSSMRSRVNRNSATTVRARTASPCASGVMDCNTTSQFRLPQSTAYDAWPFSVESGCRPYPSSYPLRN